MSYFINIPLKFNTLDLYHVRISIFNSINENLSLFNGTLIDIGCGKMPYREYLLENSNIINYIGLDIKTAKVYDTNISPDYTWDGIKMPFENNQYDCAIATEVLEHCPDPKVILKETYRILKPGAPFIFTVPFLWPLHEVPHDEYRYTPFALNRILDECGFKKIEIKALGGWNASLAQMLALWVRRSKMSKYSRFLLSRMLFPVYYFLIKTDKCPSEFKERTMITGLCGIAYK
jgi:SAM-dependent methyltransferase